MFNFKMMYIFIFLFCFGLFVFGLVKLIGRWSNNNSSSCLTVDAFVEAKRDYCSGNPGDMQSNMSTVYYVTFRFENGDRAEFAVPGAEYGLLAEGDRGKLTFKDGRYLSFERYI